MAISYEEQIGSCSASIAESGSLATRIFTVDWADAFDFATELYGRYSTWPTGEYHTPARFPYIHHLYCTAVKIDGIGIASQSIDEFGTYITYDKAKLTVQYGVSEIANEDNPEIVEEESLSVAGEMATLPSEEYEWSGDNVAIKGDILPGKITTTMQFSVTRYHRSSLHDSIISGLVGEVNNATWRGYTAGHVLFAGAAARRSITIEGAEDWEITYNFLIKNHNWNHVYRDSTGVFAAVRTRTGHDPIYDSGNFTTLGV